MSADEPTRKEIAAEIAIFVALFLLVGAAFVIWRVGRRGTSVLSYDPHGETPATSTR